MFDFLYRIQAMRSINALFERIEEIRLSSATSVGRRSPKEAGVSRSTVTRLCPRVKVLFFRSIHSSHPCSLGSADHLAALHAEFQRSGPLSGFDSGQRAVAAPARRQGWR